MWEKKFFLHLSFFPSSQKSKQKKNDKTTNIKQAFIHPPSYSHTHTHIDKTINIIYFVF